MWARNEHDVDLGWADQWTVRHKSMRVELIQHSTTAARHRRVTDSGISACTTDGRNGLAWSSHANPSRLEGSEHGRIPTALNNAGDWSLMLLLSETSPTVWPAYRHEHARSQTARQREDETNEWIDWLTA